MCWLRFFFVLERRPPRSTQDRSSAASDVYEGQALWVTTLVLATGFSILMLSPFALNSDMGMLTSIIIVVALAVDFLFLPPFLMAFDKKNTKQELTHE